MITSRQIIKLSETWSSSVTGQSNKKVDVYENPDSTDMKELNQSVKSSHFHNLIRFIANAKQQKVYVIDGYLALHGELAKVAGYPNRQSALESPSAFLGYGTLNNGKIKFDAIPDDDNSRISMAIRSIENGSKFLKHKSDEKWLSSLRRNYQWAEDFFTYNWNFVDRYFSGFTTYLTKEKQRFENWKKENYGRFIVK